MISELEFYAFMGIAIIAYCAGFVVGARPCAKREAKYWSDDFDRPPKRK